MAYIDFSICHQLSAEWKFRKPLVPREKVQINNVIIKHKIGFYSLF